MPARDKFFKRADFGRDRGEIGCLVALQSPLVSARKGPHKLVAPHDLSSKLLRGMRRQDSASALARLDQPAVLQQVLFAVCANALDSTYVGRNSVGLPRTADRPRVPSRTSTAGDSAHRYFTRDKRITRAIASDSRTNLHVWCKNQERHTLLKACSWSSALLATQRRSGDAPSGKINYPRVTGKFRLTICLRDYQNQLLEFEFW